ncbi:LysR family transcriptional regulator [Thalassotalea sp. M1531]|uniref:LysR family transcriptional regulator n=1 Tax=Thalassotalea algicola TaxID=2716224 RepID=A0A7Y0LF79_9GAMM|nr:LysR family transcriptional regulator [Thalassotalea algicola]NMP33414.1 LysR family transcriptional regulator [Thalassotalea algicola]
MEIRDLEKFILLAEVENMQIAAQQLDTTPSAISKALKRLELSIGCSLFQRIGRHIKLNEQGRVLLPRAVEITQNALDVKAMLTGINKQRLTIIGPSILLSRWASVIARNANSNLATTEMLFDTAYEQKALNAVLNGNADIGLVTTELINKLPMNLASTSLGKMDMVVAAGANNKLIDKRAIYTAELKSQQFVVPQRSPFCGEERGKGCDGWHSKLFTRKMPVVVNDFNVTVQLIKSGLYLGYVPSFWAREHQLNILNVIDLPKVEEEVLLISWQQSLLESLVY